MRSERVTRYGVLLAGLVFAAGSGGCSTMNNTEKGAGIGGALGAGTGLAIGAATGNPKTGALVGGLLGGGVGAAIGNDADRQEKERREIRQTNAAIAAANAQQKMGMMDVVRMVQAGHSDAVIVNEIRNTGSTFQLSPADLDYLKSCNVPDSVIIAMQNARPQPVVVRPRPVVVHEQPAVIYERPAPVYVVPAGPPAFGVTYVRGGRCW